MHISMTSHIDYRITYVPKQTVYINNCDCIRCASTQNVIKHVYIIMYQFICILE